jgi:hypothetical protein
MNPVLQHLYIIRAQIDLAIGALEGVPAEQAGCPHPEEKRLNLTNMGQPPHFLCLVCGDDVPGQM